MARNYAALPHEYLTEMELLNDAEFGRLIRALLVYSATGETPSLSGSERVLFPRVKAQEDRFKASYEELTQKRKAAANKSWESRKNSNRKQSNAQQCEALQDDAKPCNTETETNTETNSILPNGRDTKISSPDGELKLRGAPPKRGDASGITREQILAVKNRAERQRLINENMDLFKGGI